MKTNISIQNNKIDSLALENIIFCIPSHVYWKDVRGVYLGCNDLQAQHLGLQYGYEVIGKTDFELPWDKKSATVFRENDIEVMKAGQLKTTEEEVTIQGKTTIVLSQNVVGILGISMDITEIKEKEQALKQAKKEAEKTNQAKSEFISNMEHDIRTPCSGIAQMISILEEQEKDENKEETLHCVAKSSKQLLNLLNSIVEFEHIDNKNIPILLEKFNPLKTIKNIIDLEKPTIDLKELELIVHYDVNIPNMLVGDGHRFERILINLISNAVKFTEKGYIKIDAEIVNKKDDKTVILKIIIKDTGIGIPKDKLSFIYGKFTQVTPANKGVYSGTGLGLKIVKQFLEEMGGQIEVDSNTGRGTTFTVLFPFQLPLLCTANQNEKINEKIVETEPVIKPKPIPLKTLLVEDDKLSQMIAKNILENDFGNHVEIAETGTEALQFAKNKLYDIIFMDIGLIDIDGNAVTKEIRANKQHKNFSTPIIALTAHSTKEVRNETSKAGMDDFILKPLNANKIQTVFDRWIHHTKHDIQTEQSKTIDEADKIIDLKLATKTLGGKLKTAKQIIQTFVEMLPSHKDTITKLFELKDYPALSAEAHKLCGATCYCGVPRLKSSLTDLENAALKLIEHNKIQDFVHKVCHEIDAIIHVYQENPELRN
jgi:two-component system aerobic respiration control sensor histidine kinase ArcB